MQARTFILRVDFELFSLWTDYLQILSYFLKSQFTSYFYLEDPKEIHQLILIFLLLFKAIWKF